MIVLHQHRLLYIRDDQGFSVLAHVDLSRVARPSASIISIGTA